MKNSRASNLSKVFKLFEFCSFISKFCFYKRSWLKMLIALKTILRKNAIFYILTVGLLHVLVIQAASFYLLCFNNDYLDNWRHNMTKNFIKVKIFTFSKVIQKPIKNIFRNQRKSRTGKIYLTPPPPKKKKKKTRFFWEKTAKLDFFDFFLFFHLTLLLCLLKLFLVKTHFFAQNFQKTKMFWNFTTVFIAENFQQ